MELNTIHLHIILYAKGHYPVTKDTIKDLKILTGYFAWMEPKYVGKMDLIYLVGAIYQEVYLKHYPSMGLTELFKYVFGGFGNHTDKTDIKSLINGMLSGIRHVEMSYLPFPFPDEVEELVKIMELGSEEMTTFYDFKKV